MSSQSSPERHTSLSRSNLPIFLTALLGREYDVQTVSLLLRRQDIRLLTLTGTGGIGKTRLAVQVAADLLQEFSNGVCFVSLATINDPELVLSSIAQSLGFRDTGGQSIHEQLLTHLNTLNLLLVLDTYELLTVTAPLLADILSHSPHLKILVTSRTPLHVHGEHIYTVVPLAVPKLGLLDSHKMVVVCASVTLFLERARAVRPEFEMTSENARAIADICVRLDGVPLALELAAKWVKVLTVQQIAAQLSNATRLLKSFDQTVSPRQQSVQATIEWSYDLLSEQEQILFCRLCVFQGSCTLEGIEAVCTGNRIAAYEVLELLSHLIDQSLVQMQEVEGVAHYRLLEIIWQFGWQKLAVGGEAMALKNRHRDWYVKLAQQAEKELMGERQGAWLDRIEAEQQNFRAALRWSLEQGEGEEAAKIGVCIWPFWILRGYISEGRQFLELTLSHLSDETALRAKLLRVAGITAGHQGHILWATQLLEESLHIWRTLDEKQGIASVLLSIGVGAQLHGNYAYAMRCYEECLSLVREAGDKQLIALILTSAGLTLFYQGHQRRALSYFNESLALFQELSDLRGIAAVLTNQALIYLEQHEYEQAAILCEEALALRRTVGDKGGSAHTMIVLGHVAFAQGNYRQADAKYRESLELREASGEKGKAAEALEGLARIYAMKREGNIAARLLGAAQMQREIGGLALSPIDHTFNKRTSMEILLYLDEETFKTARDAGHHSPLKQTLELIRAMPVSLADSIPSEPLPSLHGLTARELEVLRLVAQGLSDRGVAELLVISPRTVQGHVRSIFNKIHVNSRAAAMRFAIENNLT